MRHLRKIIVVCIAVLFSLTLIPNAVFAAQKEITYQNVKFYRIDNNVETELQPGETFKENKIYKIKIDWALKNTAEGVSAGDTIKIPITFTNGVYLKGGLTANFTVDGVNAGSFTVIPDESSYAGNIGDYKYYEKYDLIATFNDALENKNNIGGTFEISFFYFSNTEGEITWTVGDDFSITNNTEGGLDPGNITTALSPLAKSAIHFKNPNTLLWGVRVNEAQDNNYLEMNGETGNTTLKEDLAYNQSDQTLMPYREYKLSSSKKISTTGNTVKVDKSNGLYGKTLGAAENTADAYLKIYEVDYETLWPLFSSDPYPIDGKLPQSFITLVNSYVAAAPVAEASAGIRPIDPGDVTGIRIAADKQSFEVDFKSDAFNGKTILVSFNTELKYSENYTHKYYNKVEITASNGKDHSYSSNYGVVSGGGTASGDTNRVSIVKVNEDGENLPGVKFKLDKSGTAFTEELKTDKNGKAVSSYLGAYSASTDFILTEITTLNGYKANKTPLVFNVDPLTNEITIKSPTGENTNWFKLSDDKKGFEVVNYKSDKKPKPDKPKKPRKGENSKTGDSNSFLLIAAMIIIPLGIIGVLVFLLRKDKRKKL